MLRNKTTPTIQQHLGTIHKKMKKAAASKLVGIKWREIHKEWFIKYLTAEQCNHQLKEMHFY